jgi:EAL domain-containing protein (putative c-di-GMP-specific phosphodiesterase class I)
MYMAKTQGKGCFSVFEQEMHEALVLRAELEADMRYAVDRNEFEVHYQPIIDLQSGRIMGMEALARWNHPTRGLILSDDFVPIAEDSKQIIPIGRQILEEACRQTLEWQDEDESKSDLSITVNITGGQFLDDSLAATVADVLAKTGLDPNSLILEITENTMLQNTEASITRLQALKNLGVRLAIDDFGTGYSSLSYLQRYPIDILKIDQSFVDKISQGKEGAAVARALITISETLHLKTIAEGIENQAQTAVLQDFGCELGQGFHFAMPLTSIEMGEFLQRSRSMKPVDPRASSSVNLPIKRQDVALSI